MHRLLHPRVHRAVHVRPQEAQIHHAAHEPGTIGGLSELNSSKPKATKENIGYTDSLTPVPMTICNSDRFFGTKKDLLIIILKTIRYSVNRIQWHF